MRTTLLTVLLTATFAAAQTAPPPQNAPAADRATYQQAHNSYDAQADAFRAAVKAALAAEGTHEAAFICPNVADPTEMNGCVAHENDITTANYQAFTTALRSLLALPGPPAPSPQATPASSAASAISTWKWMSATIGTGERGTIWASPSAAASRMSP